MITQTTNNLEQVKHAAFISLVDEYKALLATQDVSFSIVIDEIIRSYKSKLFSQLLALDKGMKFKWEQIKNEQAKLDLIDSSFEVEGHEFINDVIAKIDEIRMYARQNLFIYVKSYCGTIYDFADRFQLDLVLLLNSATISWDGKQDEYQYILSLTAKFEEIRRVFPRAYRFELQDTLNKLCKLLWQSEGTVSFNELSCWHFLRTNDLNLPK